MAENNSTKTTGTMGATLLASITGIFSAVGSIWTSSNNIKAEKLAIEKLEAEKESTADFLKQQQLIQALEIKKQTLASTQAAETSKTTLRGILIVVGGTMVGILGYFFLKRNPRALTMKS